MTYSWHIYYPGPRTRWSGKIHAREIIAGGSAPWRWLARSAMLAAFRPLDPSVVGYALLRDGVCVEQYDPPPEAMGA